jgi:hypothetical protein
VTKSSIQETEWSVAAPKARDGAQVVMPQKAAIDRPSDRKISGFHTVLVGRQSPLLIFRRF